VWSVQTFAATWPAEGASVGKSDRCLNGQGRPWVRYASRWPAAYPCRSIPEVAVVGIDIGKNSSDGLRIFAPPFGPSNFMGHTGGRNDSALFGGTKYPTKASQGGLNEPRC